LGQHRAVDELDHRVDDRLGVHDDVDPLEGDAEQPVGLQDLEPLVHEGGRVDRDLRPHPPRRVAERLLDRHGLERRTGRPAEGTTRRGQHEAADLAGRRPGKTLEERAVLGVDREQAHAVLARGARHERARHHQRLLVGERDGTPGPDRGERGHEARGPHQRRDDDVRGDVTRDGRQALGPPVELRPGRRQLPGQAIDGGPIEERHGRRPMGADLPGDQGDVGPARGEAADAELVREGGDELEGPTTDRAGRSEHGDGFHV
jgi:hypothetical protein